MVVKLVTPVADAIDYEIDKLLAEFSPQKSRMLSVAYDTAWLVRAIPYFPKHGFEEALTWMRHAQHPDGSWGGNIIHYHDRVICTLSAITALTILGESEDAPRIRAGQSFLWREAGKLHYDADETIAFPLLITILSREATALGLDIPENPLPNLHVIDKKLDALRSAPEHWRHSTITHSFEALSNHLQPDRYDFLEKNFSVAASPAATVAVLIQGANALPKDVMNYLTRVHAEQGDGGLPNVAPIDTFEMMWALENLRRANAITPEHPAVRRILDYLWQVWSAKRGVGFSSQYTIQDLDDTSMGFGLLRWGGYPVDTDVFAYYEESAHFRCFPGEVDPSWNAHIRMLSALQTETHHPNYEAWTLKIIRALNRSRHGYYWFDKWHISPYYPTCAAIQTLLSYDRQNAEAIIHWLLKTQRDDGGWGYYGQSTAEETAYCMLALLNWDRDIWRIDKTCLDAANQYLSAHYYDTIIPTQWIGKCLYVPYRVVKAAELAAMYLYNQHAW